mmetsp:Transcript_8489/g.18640  ORF Transcript_8489/g.18640 Transcript_8489/m.18640 type:complete len:269 (+) Transcript_8489:1048-1854(+)
MRLPISTTRHLGIDPPPLLEQRLQQLPIDHVLASLAEVLVQLLAEDLGLHLAADVHRAVVREHVHVARRGVEARGRLPEVLAAAVKVPPRHRVLVQVAVVHRVRHQLQENVLDLLGLGRQKVIKLHLYGEGFRGPGGRQLGQDDGPRVQLLELLGEPLLQQVDVLLPGVPVLDAEADDDHGEGGEEALEGGEDLAGVEEAEVLVHEDGRQEHAQGPVDAVQQVGQLVVLVENDVDQLEYHSIQYGHGELQAYGSEVQFEPLVRVLHSV